VNNLRVVVDVVVVVIVVVIVVDEDIVFRTFFKKFDTFLLITFVSSLLCSSLLDM
jgi:hypothetical protein